MTAGQGRRALGTYGETVAARYLSEAGMRVLDRNWRCDLGELDLVLLDDGTLVVCEVKTRTSDAFGHPLEAVTAVKLARLRRLAALWLTQADLTPRDVRIDLVGVRLDRVGDARIDHVRGVG